VIRTQLKNAALIESPKAAGDLRPSLSRRWRWTRWVPLLLIFVGLVLWEWLTSWLAIPRYLMPSPSAIWAEFATKPSGLLYDLCVTALESVGGFAIAIIFAIGAAILFAQSRVMYSSLMPYLIALKAVPLIAIAPLLVIWLGNGFISKAVMVATICFFPIVVNLTRGLRDIPEEQLDLMKSLGANSAQIFVRIRVPNSLPYLFAALKIASTLSVVGAIVAEFAGANEGIGYVILVAALRTDTALTFCGIVLASVLGMLLYYILEFMEHWIIDWEVTDE
jgi:NitT/TauT family transport system permease protein